VAAMTKRRTYTKEFKSEAVELADKIDNSGRPLRTVYPLYSDMVKYLL
jgi:hypothetical protein